MEGLNYLLEIKNNTALSEELYFEALEVVNKMKENRQLDNEDREIVEKVKNINSNGLKTYFSLIKALYFYSISMMGEIKYQEVEIN